MADVEAGNDGSANRAPLLLPIGSQKVDEKAEEEVGVDGVDETLKRLELFLTVLGFKQSSGWSSTLWWGVFFLIVVVAPVVILQLTDCSGDCEKYQISKFELDIVASQACLAAVSLMCLSHNLRKFGIRRFLFVDRCTGHMARFREEYVKMISKSVRLLAIWILPCFFFKTGREILRLLNVRHESWWVSLSVLVGLVGSWTYTCIVYLSACVIFRLVCNLQITQFDDYVKLLEREGDVLVLIEEHTRLRYCLSKISHRFRIFLVLEFVVVSASQFVTLFQTTGCSGMITIINGSDFAISSLVQVVGVILCLNGATKISHRAQALAFVASRWHSLVTCSSADGSSQIRSTNGSGNFEATNTFNSFQSEYSESDMDSLEFGGMPSNTQFPSHMSSYHRRQSFVLYLQNNPGGITIYGWTVDRGLITTIFFVELSLVTFVLGKTIVFAA
ncbi:unnamed protein product [Rhodiola kirilowii]